MAIPSMIWTIELRGILDPEASDLSKVDIRKKSRGIKKQITQIYKDALKRIHDEHVETHFERAGYGKYQATYAQDRIKKAPGRPMFETGMGLLRRMKPAARESEIRGGFRGSGDSAGVRVEWKRGFGRPAKYSGKHLRRAVMIEMRRRGGSYEEARVRVLRRSGYSAKSKAVFAKRLGAVAQVELKEEAKRMTAEIVGIIEGRKAARRRMKPIK